MRFKPAINLAPTNVQFSNIILPKNFNKIKQKHVKKRQII